MLVYQAARTTVSIKISMTSRFRIFLVILGVGRISSLGTLPRCPPGWLLSGQSCWMPLMGIFDMAEAQQECRQRGSNLPAPNSKAENDFVVWLFRETWPNGKRSLWLGCTVKPPNNTLTCLGSLGYQPHIIGSDNPDNQCVLINRNGTWSSNDCVRRRYTICERPATRFTSTLFCSAASLNVAGHVRSYCLLDHTISVTQTKTPMQCCLACFKDPNCQSFNLSGKTCQLNNVTASQADADQLMASTEGCVHYRFVE